MAYLDTRPHALVWTPSVTLAPAIAPMLLARIERDVLLASRRDRVSSLATPGPLARWIGRLIGVRAPNGLADPRLEALRRFAVLLRRRGEKLPTAEQARMIAAGYSPGQVVEVRRIVERERRVRRRPWRRRTMALVALVFAVEMVIFRLASAYFSDGLVGFAFTLTTLIAGTPLLNLFRRDRQPR